MSGIAGNDIDIGADILIRAALSSEFASASGLYFDNDTGKFAPPHRDASDPLLVGKVVDAISSCINEYETKAL